MSYRIEHLSKRYGSLVIFDDFNISFEESKITCLLGASGCGKTTLLNIIGGITPPDGGTLVGFEGRTFSYIFQEPRLLPWKTVQGNIEFVLDPSLSAAQRHQLAMDLMQRVALSDFANYYPAQLSGGMRQRVSIARSFAIQSDIILMDEPLNGLDAALKRTLIAWFREIWNEDRRTVIYVTHDEDEAALLADATYRLGTH